MPASIDAKTIARKRKRSASPRCITRALQESDLSGPHVADHASARIRKIETEVCNSRKSYNQITALICMVRQSKENDSSGVLASLALCRIFTRLIAKGALKRQGGTFEHEEVVRAWLTERYREYQEIVLDGLRKGRHEQQTTNLKLLMMLAKEDGIRAKTHDGATSGSTLFSQILMALVTSRDPQIQADFHADFVEKYDDVRLYTFNGLTRIATAQPTSFVVNNMISMLKEIKYIPESESRFYFPLPTRKMDDSRSSNVQKKAAQQVWMSIVTQRLSRAQKKRILHLIPQSIVPWFLKPELLMDFLTDSFNAGGSISFMALAGLFHMIQLRNLDYPQFYTKLYSLVDQHVLSSKYRSRFFRLLTTFLASTHLPAVIVASFIKRLSRLCLYSPPSGIVNVVPWVYNLLKAHPTCTFMIQRDKDLSTGQSFRMDTGWEDPFKVDEADPALTNAIESCLWEIQTLQKHYHSGVATISRVISEQFTLQAYSLDDFLDHTYANMIGADLTRDTKRSVVVEYEIPQAVFTGNFCDTPAENLLNINWRFDVESAYM